eukprot:6418083-Karenia_brevis.AAC.1
MELFAWSGKEAKGAQIVHSSTLKRLIFISQKAPTEALHCLTGIGTCDVEWRVRRLSLLLRLLNSPPDSWQHIALVSMKLDASPWFEAAECDLYFVVPGIRLEVGSASFGPFLFSNGWWSDDGLWHCAQPFTLPVDYFGRRH